MKAIHKKRLLNVAKALRESPAPEKFHMQDYAHPCGTPACAWGHYVARTDLQSEFVPEPHEGLGFVCRTRGGSRANHNTPMAREHFGLDREDIDELFSDFLETEDGEVTWGCGGARTAIEAAEYIEDFVRRRS